MGTSQWTQVRRQGEGHQEIGTGQKAAALPNKPALGLILVTLRAGAIAAGAVGKDFLPAVIALVEMTSKERRMASGHNPDGPVADRGQGGSGLVAVPRA